MLEVGGTTGLMQRCRKAQVPAASAVLTSTRLLACRSCPPMDQDCAYWPAASYDSCCAGGLGACICT